MQRQAVRGIKNFGRFLNDNHDTFYAAPILLVESSLRATTASQAKSKREDPSRKAPSSELSQHVQLLLGSSNMRSTATSPSSEHFPYVEDVQYTADFAKRLGATTIIGVGGASAMELAKAVAQEHTTVEELVLIPGTDHAILSSASSHSLILDPAENALIPRPSSQVTSLREDLGSHLVLPRLGRSKEKPALVSSAVYSGLVLGLDSLYRGDKDEEECLAMIQSAATLLDHIRAGQRIGEVEESIEDLMLWAGSDMSFGLTSTSPNSYRSIPLSLTCSLIPTAFAGYSFVDFMSCLLPGMLSTVEAKSNHGAVISQISSRFMKDCPKLVPLPGNETDIKAMMAQIRDNADLWDCVDANNHVLEKVLQDSLNQ